MTTASFAKRLALLLFVLIVGLGFNAHPAAAQVAPVDPNPTVSNGPSPTTTVASRNTSGPSGPQGPTGPTGSAASSGTASINLDLGQALNKPSQSITIIILITLLSVAPSLLIMTTSFTRIIVVMTITRNALGVPSVPPNQVLVGLALFLSLFIMGPTFNEMNKQGIQPYINGQITQQQAFDATTKPLKAFMLKNTRKEELGLFVKASGQGQVATASDAGLTAVIPAFILSELKTAFIIGFVVYIPFLVIDIIVSSSLMSMGMMMLPPQMISLPFKLLLFVLVDGWGLIVKSLLASIS
jgi:flagellar biosynthetic protein FliP